MIRYILPAALALTIGCRAQMLEVDPDNGCDLDDTATDTADTAEDTGIETGTVDSDTAQEIDTASEDTAQDSGFDTATVTEDCAFEVVTTGTNTIIIGNELQFSLNPERSGEEVTSGYNEILRFDVTSLHSECDDIEITFLAVNFLVSDNAETGWFLESPDRHVDVWDITTNHETIMNLRADLIPDEDGFGGYAAPRGSMMIAAGTMHTIVVNMDTTGLSEELDDSIQVTLANQITAVDIDRPFRISDGEITNTLVY